jgi:hypothetical protein
MKMSVQFSTRRNHCGTIEAARLYGCSRRHIRTLAERGEIWSERISDRIFVYDADEIRALAAQKAALRKAGKLCGRRPSGLKSA